MALQDKMTNKPGRPDQPSIQAGREAGVTLALQNSQQNVAAHPSHVV